MLQQLLSEDNIKDALRALKEKPDTAGIDGVRLSDLPEYWKLNRERITLELSLSVVR